MSKKRGRKKGGVVRDRNISTLAQHQRQGKALKPPFLQHQKQITFSSWRDERLPDVLWAALLAGNLDREIYLGQFRRVIAAAKATGDASVSVAHSASAKMSEDAFDRTFAAVLGDDRAAHVLSALLLFDALPDRHHWVRSLRAPNPEEHVPLLATAVAATIDHQSEQSTDCRWLKLAFIIAMGRMRFAPQMEEMVRLSSSLTVATCEACGQRYAPRRSG
jgi:hypothetical protein